MKCDVEDCVEQAKWKIKYEGRRYCTYHKNHYVMMAHLYGVKFKVLKLKDGD
jgi:hypothetical protein